MSRVVKYHIEYSSETKQKALQLYIDDLTRQIEHLNKNKHLFSYNAYRYMYMRLYTQLGNYKRQLEKIK